MSSKEAQDFKEDIKEFFISHKLLLQIVNLLYTAFIWEKSKLVVLLMITFIALADFLFFSYTNWRFLTYVVIVTLESCGFFFFLIRAKEHFLNASEDEAKQSLTSLLDSIFDSVASLEDVNFHKPLDDIESLKKYRDDEFYIPTLLSAGFIILFIISNILPGWFFALVFLAGVLFGPGCISRGLHTQFYDDIWVPKVVPFYNNTMKPLFEQLVEKLSTLTGTSSSPTSSPTSSSSSSSSSPSSSAPDVHQRHLPITEAELELSNVLKNIGQLADDSPKNE